jgi:hypothetical protein
MADHPIFGDFLRLHDLFAEVVHFTGITNLMLKSVKNVRPEHKARLQQANDRREKILTDNMRHFAAYKTNMMAKGIMQFPGDDDGSDIIAFEPIHETPDDTGLKMAVQNLEELLDIALPLLDEQHVRGSFKTAIDRVEVNAKKYASDRRMEWTPIEPAARVAAFVTQLKAPLLASLLSNAPKS